MTVSDIILIITSSKLNPSPQNTAAILFVIWTEHGKLSDFAYSLPINHAWKTNIKTTALHPKKKNGEKKSLGTRKAGNIQGSRLLVALNTV